MYNTFTGEKIGRKEGRKEGRILFLPLSAGRLGRGKLASEIQMRLRACISRLCTRINDKHGRVKTHIHASARIVPTQRSARLGVGESRGLEPVCNKINRGVARERTRGAVAGARGWRERRRGEERERERRGLW